MCTYSSESQLYPGLHQKKCDQQDKGGERPLCSCETPPGDEALAQAAPRSCGCSISGGVQGQVGWGFKPDPMGGIPAYGTGWTLWSLPTQTILWICDLCGVLLTQLH